jgi:O-antigen ligase
MKKEKILAWLNSAIYWEIIIIPFVASFSSAAVNVFIGLLAASFLAKRMLLRKAGLVFSPLTLMFLLLISASAVSFVNSVNLHSSLQGITKLLKYGILLLALPSEVRGREHIKKIIIASMLGLATASFDGVIQLVFGKDLFRHEPYDLAIGLPRLKAAFPHTNIFAGYLALFIPLSAALFFHNTKGRVKEYLGRLFMVAAFCLIFTLSRSAVLGVWLAVFIIGLMRRSWPLVVALIAMVLVAPFLAPKSIKDWSGSTGSVAELLLNRERFPIYETSFNMIGDHPIIGVGVNTYCLNYQKYKLHNTSDDTADTMWYAHNSYLHMASETGLIGFTIFLAILFTLFLRWRRFYALSNDGFLKAVSLGIILGIFAFLIHGLTESNLYYPKIAVMFWFELALLAAIIYPKKEGGYG